MSATQPAPTSPHPSHPTKATLSTLHSARVSFRLPQPLLQYDQAGLLLSLRQPETAESTSPPPKWIKTGVEFYNNHPRAATVACDAFADWSLAPLTRSSGQDEGWVTVAIENGKDELGKSFWVYQLVGDDKIPLREICWPFGNGGGAWEVTVEAYACRPNKETEEQLEVAFKDFAVKWV